MSPRLRFARSVYNYNSFERYNERTLEMKRKAIFNDIGGTQIKKHRIDERV